MDYNIIDILLDSELFDDVLLAKNYADISDDYFIDLLIKYREKVDTLLVKSTRDYLRNSSPLNIYIPEKKYSDYLSKALLSMDSVIIDDEIVSSLYYIKDYPVSKNIIGLNQNPVKIAKADVAEFIRYIKKNQLLISNGSIQVLPNKTNEYESIKKKTVLYNQADERYLLDYMPKSTINLYKKSINILPRQRVGQSDDAIFFRNLKKKSIAGELSLSIEDCNSEYVNGYVFSLANTFYDENGKIQIDQETRVRSIPKTRALYDDWVGGVINRTITEHFINLNLNISQASEINSSLAYDCNFTNKILNNINKEGNLNRKILEVNTPFFNGISPNTIAKIKNDYGDSFDSYKKVVRETAFKLQLTTDKHHIEMINREFKERIYDEGTRNVELALKNLRKIALKELIIESGIAGIGFIESKLTIISMATAGIGMFRTINSLKERGEAVKNDPSYFLLKTRPK